MKANEYRDKVRDYLTNHKLNDLPEIYREETSTNSILTAREQRMYLIST